RQGVARAAGVAYAERRLRRDRDGADAVLQEDAHLGHRRLAQRRARVVVSEDLGVAVAVLRVAVRAVLSHPDAVAPAVALDDIRGEGGRSLSSRQPNAQNGTQERRTPDHAGCSLRAVSPGIRGPPVVIPRYDQAVSTTGARSLSGSHQSRLDAYHSTVAARPSPKSVCGCHPSSRRSLPESSR